MPALVTLVSRQTKLHWHSIIQAGFTRKIAIQKWSPPPKGAVKINTDASFINGNSTAGIIFGDHCGTVTHAAVFKHKCLDSFSAECLALLDACNLLIELNIHNATLESDCLNAITFIVDKSEYCFWQADAVISKIRKLLDKWPLWSFCFAPRVANGAAHALAYWAWNNELKGFVPLNSLPVTVFCDLGFPIVEVV
ncbi:hypothetical protein CASFOL_009437 [Castilleja foliolosa]|uniref:RNase H type-1 domain-containing protein n=1 Tax=Castilleja foliolosa TaxID=1961234 RepID=A0ABD3DXN4_9LAMI